LLLPLPLPLSLPLLGSAASSVWSLRYLSAEHMFADLDLHISILCI
jgi:hypothetical protein